MKSSLIKITCPECKQQTDFEIYQTIDLNKEPELAQRLMNLSLFRFVCPKCGCNVLVEYPFSVMDDHEMFFIFCFPGNKDVTEDNVKLISLTTNNAVKDKGFLFRFVDNREALSEKISIFYTDYDDRAIEVYKLKNDSLWHKRFPTMTAAYFANDVRKGLSIYIFSNLQLLAVLPFKETEYDAIVDKYFYDSDLRSQDLKVVNRAWAKEYLEQFEKVS